MKSDNYYLYYSIISYCCEFNYYYQGSNLAGPAGHHIYYWVPKISKLRNSTPLNLKLSLIFV